MPTTASPSTTNTDDRVSQHLRALVDDAEALIKATARATDETYDSARSHLHDDLAQLRVRLTELESRAAGQLKVAAHQTDQTVHAHPYTAMGVAALVGVALGALMRSR
jgi:ElaB/YqjD/DUF883 family membrane-anchored ribosome-binding protein